MNDRSEQPQPGEGGQPSDRKKLQVSILGVQAKAEPGAEPYTPPKSLGELGARCWRHFLTLLELPLLVVARTGGTVVDAITGIGSIFTVPSKEEFEQQGEQAEQQAREEAGTHVPEQALNLPSPESQIPDPEEMASADVDSPVGLAAAHQVLSELAEQGLAVEIRDLGNGRVGIYLVPPELLDATIEIVDLKTLAIQQGTEQLTDASTLLDRPVAEFELSPRVLRGLKNLGVRTIRQLVQLSADDLLAVDGFGPKSLEEITDQLMFLGLKLRTD